MFHYDVGFNASERGKISFRTAGGSVDRGNDSCAAFAVVVAVALVAFVAVIGLQVVGRD